LIVGISGATGVRYGIRILQALRDLAIDSHLIMTRTAEITLAYESDMKVAHVHALADAVHRVDDLAAAPSSGSFRTMGMVVAPCSVRALAEVAAGTGNNLLTRAADVTLKERRRLVLMVRETPLHLGHIRNMAAVTEMGGIIAPPVPAFYSRPRGLDDVIDHTVGRVLDLFGLDSGLAGRWKDDD
jgi:4-hydroxy-3-polyprenylbenzoate decarboxylase